MIQCDLSWSWGCIVQLALRTDPDPQGPVRSDTLEDHRDFQLLYIIHSESPIYMYQIHENTAV